MIILAWKQAMDFGLEIILGEPQGLFAHFARSQDWRRDWRADCCTSQLRSQFLNPYNLVQAQVCIWADSIARMHPLNESPHHPAWPNPWSHSLPVPNVLLSPSLYIWNDLKRLKNRLLMELYKAWIVNWNIKFEQKKIENRACVSRQALYFNTSTG